MNHWPIEKGENDVMDALSAVYEVVYLSWVTERIAFVTKFFNRKK